MTSVTIVRHDDNAVTYIGGLTANGFPMTTPETNQTIGTARAAPLGLEPMVWVVAHSESLVPPPTNALPTLRWTGRRNVTGARTKRSTFTEGIRPDPLLDESPCPAGSAPPRTSIRRWDPAGSNLTVRADGYQRLHVDPRTLKRAGGPLCFPGLKVLRTLLPSDGRLAGRNLPNNSVRYDGCAE